MKKLYKYLFLILLIKTIKPRQQGPLIGKALQSQVKRLNSKHKTSKTPKRILKTRIKYKNHLKTQRNLQLAPGKSMPKAPGITILPPRIVTQAQAEKMNSSPGSPLPMQIPSTASKAHKKRKLNVLPYTNMGPGYMDVGGNGFSPLSFAMSNPQFPSMSPFIPRTTPPPPIRVQLKDSIDEHYKSQFLTPSEMKVKTKDAEVLREEIGKESAMLIAELRASKENLGEYFRKIKTELGKVDSHRKTVEKEVGDLKMKIREAGGERRV